MGKHWRDLIASHSEATRSARAVLNVLASYANEAGVAWPGRATIARECGLSERTVIRCLQQLVGEDRIAVIANERGGRGQKPRYQLRLPELNSTGDIKGDKYDAKRVTSTTLKGDNGDNKRVTSTTIKGDKYDIPIIRNEPNREPYWEPEGDPRAPATPPFRGEVVNGKVKAGTGNTAARVFHEVYSLDGAGHQLTETMVSQINSRVTDLELWRDVVVAWALSDHKPTNIRGQLDWYDDPSRFKARSNTITARASPTSKVAASLSAIDEYEAIKARHESAPGGYQGGIE